MAEFDLIIRGGTIVDGTLTPRYVSDLAVKDGKVAQIGGLKGSRAASELDAAGLVVGPGFVDLHTHYDAQVQWDPYCTLSGWHGVTTVLLGNCGFGFAPCRPEDRDRSMLTMTRNEAIPFESMKAGMLWDWVTFPDWLDSLDRIPKGVNVFSFVPLSPIYAWVMGLEEAKSRRPTADELERMCGLIHEGMDAGACGWSAQVLGEGSDQRDFDGSPMITDLLADEELLAFANVLAERGEGCIELAYFKESDETGRFSREESLSFIERVAEVARQPVIFQTIAADDNHPDVFRRLLKRLAADCQRGLRVYGQGGTRRYKEAEFTLEDWNLFDNSPAWREATVGTAEQRKAKMQDPEMRARMRAEWDAGFRPGQSGVIDQSSLEGLVIGDVGLPQLHSEYLGLTVGQVAAQEGKHVVDAMLDLAVAEDLQTTFYARAGRGSGPLVAELLASPYVVPGLSDGGAHVKFQVSGNFPTELLIWLVKEEGVMSIEEAHHKLSYLPAFFGGARDRGSIREGAPADLLVYDLEGLELLPPEISYDFPANEWRRVQRAKGYRWVLVNGQITFVDGEPTGHLPGRLLRHGRRDG